MPEQARPATSAALIDALDNLSAVDSIVVTRVITEKKGDDEICASVYGRGVRLTKASASQTEVKPPGAATNATQADDDDSDGE